MRVMITGGGTGGHTSPAQAFVEELRVRDPRLLLQWIGKNGGIEQRVAKNLQIPFRSLWVEGWPRKTSPRMPWAVMKMGLACLRSAMYLQKFQPDIVLGVGGYVSLPLMWTAQRMGLRTILHEQNKRMGMANRMLAPNATRVFLSYENTEGPLPADRSKVVGNPVRAGFLSPPNQSEACKKLGLAPAIPVVLAVGGSQGAQSINNAVAGMLPQLDTDEMQLIWMTGKSGHAAAQKAADNTKITTQVHAFIDDMVTASAAAQLVIGRAGASSTAELAMLGKPSILIPYPHATDNHQEENARAFEEAGAAVLLLDGECSPERLLSEVRGILQDESRQGIMADAAARLARPGAAEQVVDVIMEMVFGGAGQKNDKMAPK